MKWDINFISYKDFYNHTKETIAHYSEALDSYDLRTFNASIIDPVKMVFDKAVYNKSWEDLISSEIARQRDKSNNNEIGYFHQRLFKYIKNCRVPDNGKEGGWDVIVSFPRGYEVAPGSIVHKIYVEMKNKHNTMNSTASQKTYIKMQSQILDDDDSACFLVEVIAKQHQNITWSTTTNGRKVANKNLRRVSIDEFYKIVTGEEDAFYQICMKLPLIVKDIMSKSETHGDAHDTVIAEIMREARKYDMPTKDLSVLMVMYMLGFHTYNGFRDQLVI